LQKLRDDRVLAEMTRRVFSVAFAWSVVETKWLGFEEAFSASSHRGLRSSRTSSGTI
jgi:3-methyladenine DNA glycosylase Tag